MTKQEQIEEMASLIENCNTTCDECFKQYERCMKMKIKEREKRCQAYMFAKRAVEQGYRKISEGAVVLTREKYQDLQEYKNIAEQRKFNIDYANVELRRLEFELKQVHKETAEEIISFIESKDKKGGKYSIYTKLLQELKEKYNLEVEE